MSDLLLALGLMGLGAVLTELVHDFVRSRRREDRAREQRTRQAFNAETEADRFVSRVMREENARRRREALRAIPGGKDDPKGAA